MLVGEQGGREIWGRDNTPADERHLPTRPHRQGAVIYGSFGGAPSKRLAFRERLPPSCVVGVSGGLASQLHLDTGGGRVSTPWASTALGWAPPC